MCCIFYIKDVVLIFHAQAYRLFGRKYLKIYNCMDIHQYKQPYLLAGDSFPSSLSNLPDAAGFTWGTLTREGMHVWPVKKFRRPTSKLTSGPGGPGICKKTNHINALMDETLFYR
jgi:hypothetical protein